MLEIAIYELLFMYKVFLTVLFITRNLKVRWKENNWINDSIFIQNAAIKNWVFFEEIVRHGKCVIPVTGLKFSKNMINWWLIHICNSQISTQCLPCDMCTKNLYIYLVNGE